MMLRVYSDKWHRFNYVLTTDHDDAWESDLALRSWSKGKRVATEQTHQIRENRLAAITMNGRNGTS